MKPRITMEMKMKIVVLALVFTLHVSPAVATENEPVSRMARIAAGVGIDLASKSCGWRYDEVAVQKYVVGDEGAFTADERGMITLLSLAFLDSDPMSPADCDGWKATASREGWLLPN
jgi:hypothetical protein